MKHYKLYIETPTSAAYQRVTKLLGIAPEAPGHNSEEPHSLWTCRCSEDEALDMTGFFLDLLEPKFGALQELGIARHHITLTCFYDPEQHCAMDFSSQQLKRLGDSGISLSIDAWPSGLGQVGAKAC